MEKLKIIGLISGVVGAVYISAIYQLYEVMDWQPMSYVFLSLLVISPISLLLSLLMKQDLGFIVLSVFLGIATGITIDALLDNVDRNLFPIEILLWSALTLPAVLLGIGLAKVILRVSANKSITMKEK